MLYFGGVPDRLRLTKSLRRATKYVGKVFVRPGTYVTTSCTYLEASLPEIRRFLGIVIAMYYRDHRPPHFHAKYGSYEIVVSIEDGVVEGRFPRRALQHVLEWFTTHRQALMENWELAEQRKPLKPIPPLE